MTDIPDTARQVFPFLSLPLEVVLQILSEFSFVDWASNTDDSGAWHGNVFLTHCQLLEADNQANLSAKRALYMVSKTLRSLMHRTMFEFVSIRNAHRLHMFGKTLQRSREYASLVSRYTKRLDLVISEEPQSSHAWIHRPARDRELSSRLSDKSKSVCAIAESIVRACPRLTHLSICMFNEQIEIGVGHPFMNVIADACPSLRVLKWQFGPKVALEPLILIAAANLRVLDISKVAMFFRPSEIDVTEMPHLHTLRGPVDIVCSAFSLIHLPALRTFIAEVPRDAAYDAEVCGEFFEKHGGQLTSLSINSSSMGELSLEPVENLRELAFHVLNKDLLAPKRTLQKVLQIGIVGKASDVSSTVTDGATTTHLWGVVPNLIYSISEHILTDLKTTYPELKAVRILNGTLVKKLQEKWIICQKLVGKFLTAGVRFEDDKGDLIYANVELGTESLKSIKTTRTKNALRSLRYSPPRMIGRSQRSPRSSGRTLTTIDSADLAKGFSFRISLREISHSSDTSEISANVSEGHLTMDSNALTQMECIRTSIVPVAR